MKLKLLILFFLSNILILSAQSQQELAQNYLKEKGEVFFTFKASSKSQIIELSNQITFDKIPNLKTLEVFGYANKSQFENFLKLGIPFEVSKKDNGPLLIDLKNKVETAAKTQAWNMTSNSYPTYSDYVGLMNSFVTNYPDLCSLESIGKTKNNRDIWMLKISDNVDDNEAEPEFMYNSSMHGNELTGFPLMLRLIDYLLSNYGTDAEATEIVDSTVIYINPLANPDGTYRSEGSNTISSPTRANSNGQDLNRNYPDNVSSNRLHYDSTGGVYENETLAFMKFEETKNIVLSANFHGGVEVINYPYDNTYTKHADHDFYEYISVEYATNNQNDSPGVNYMTTEYDYPENPRSPGVTQGAIWYVVYGGRQDYMNYFRHSKEIVVELSAEKWDTNIIDLRDLWNYNKQALLDLIKQADNGLQGIVSDESGNPVPAKISISGHDKLNSWITANNDLGDYYRLIKGGSYNVTFEAPGYITQNINVSVTDDSKTIQNVTMVATTSEPTAADVDICDSGSASLSATGSGTLKWYDSVDARTSVFTGANFDTPTLNTTTSYFVEDVIEKENVGEIDNSSNGGFLGGERYLLFDCTESVKLEQVTVNANQAGELEVQLQDSSGNMLDSRIIILENSGIQTIDLDFIIPTGSNLRLSAVELSSGLNLYRTTSSGTNFPYTNGSITITDGSASNYYYFFYDWVLGDYKSARKEVVVNVNPSPIANYTYVINPSNNGEVTFTNSSTNAASYIWDFGDGTGSSIDMNPTYSYSSSGTFDVKLTSVNTKCGNDDITIQLTVGNTLGIDNEILNAFSIYPNPVSKGEIKITMPREITSYDVSVSNGLGQKLFFEEVSILNQEIYSVNISNLNAGIYFITIQTEDEKATKKLIIQ